MKLQNFRLSLSVLIICFIVSATPAFAQNDHISMMVNSDSLTVKTDNGIFAVPGDRLTSIDAGNGNKLEITYNLKAAIITIKELCGSTNPIDVEVEILKLLVTVDPCKEKDILLSTAEEGPRVLDTLEDVESLENPDDLREPMTEF